MMNLIVKLRMRYFLGVLMNHRSLLVFLAMIINQVVRMQDPVNKSQLKNSGYLKHEKRLMMIKAELISQPLKHLAMPHLLFNDRSSETGVREEKDQVNNDENRTSKAEIQGNNIDSDKDSNFYSHEVMERLTCKYGSMHDNLRLTSDFQMRDMVAKVVMKMVAMFGYNSDEDVY